LVKSSKNYNLNKIEESFEGVMNHSQPHFSGQHKTLESLARHL